MSLEFCIILGFCLFLFCFFFFFFFVVVFFFFFVFFVLGFFYLFFVVFFRFRERSGYFRGIGHLQVFSLGFLSKLCIGFVFCCCFFFLLLFFFCFFFCGVGRGSIKIQGREPTS